MSTLVSSTHPPTHLSRPTRDGASVKGAAVELARALRPGHVYRREDLARHSTSVDRHLRRLVDAGLLRKLAPGLYHVPKQSSFGPLPPADDQLVRGFLRDKHFLVFSPSAYNTAGLGTTQVYNKTLVYNHKRHGLFQLGNRQFDFRMKQRFPAKLTPEFLYVDLLNNLGELAEDRDEVLRKAQDKVSEFDPARLRNAVENFGNAATRKRFREWLNA